MLIINRYKKSRSYKVISDYEKKLKFFIAIIISWWLVIGDSFDCKINYRNKSIHQNLILMYALFVVLAANDKLVRKKRHNFIWYCRIIYYLHYSVIGTYFQIPAEVRNVIFKLSIIKDYLQHNYCHFFYA